MKTGGQPLNVRDLQPNKKLYPLEQRATASDVHLSHCETLLDGHVNVDRDYTTNGLNQYVTVGDKTLTYDDNGNLISDGTKSYEYDLENRLVKVTAGNRETQLYYDPLGRLYRILDDDTGETNFVYDGNELVAEYDGSGQLLRRYVHGASPTADDPLVWHEGDEMNSTTRRYIHADPRGSIVAVTDRPGSLIAVNSYDEYGIPDTASGDDIATKGRFRYTGQAWLPELGMYYYKARIYSPTLGRFMQTDPIGYEDQFNLYAYVGNDPINGIDPTGLDCEGTASCSPAMYPRQPEYTVNCGTYGNCSMEQQARARGQVSTVPLDDPSVQQAGEAMVERGLIIVTAPLGGPSAQAGKGFFARALSWLGVRTGVSSSARFASSARLADHFVRHGGDFASRTAAAYQRAASRFLTGSPGRGVLQKTRGNGDVVRFNPKTDEFGVLSKGGDIRTYYKPDPKRHGLKSNLEYFNAQ